MKYRLWPQLGTSVARIIFGAAALANRREHYRLLDAIYAVGGNTFETARTYGESENCLGVWRRDRQLSDKITIITKGGHPAASRHRLSYPDLLADVHRSLRALRMEQIDLFLLHRDDPGTRPEETIEVLNELQAMGLIKAFGVSNWAAARIEKAQTHARLRGLSGLSASSPHLSLAEWNCPPWEGCRSLAGSANEQECAWYDVNNLPVLAWSSLAGGFFSSRAAVAVTGDASPERAQTMKVYHSRANLRRLERAQLLAQRRSATLAQIALAYVLGRLPEVHAIVGCSNSSHFSENVGACDIELTHSERHWLDLQATAP